MWNSAADGMSFDILFHDESFTDTLILPYVGQPLLYDSIGVIALGILLHDRCCYCYRNR